MAGAVSGRQERKSARGNRFAFAQLSDPSGLYEVTVFSDVLDASRDLLEAGQNVVLTVEANLESDQLKLLARSVVPVDTGLARAGRTEIRVFIEEEAAAGSVKSLLERYREDTAIRGRGSVTLSTLGVELLVGGMPQICDIDISLGDGWPMNPQIKGALKSLHGVVAVEEL
jgi:DNA polymerase-3 subunit alpha